MKRANFRSICAWTVKLSLSLPLPSFPVRWFNPSRKRFFWFRGCKASRSYSQIAAATKALHDVAPGALLLAALQGLGDAFGISEIAAVSAARQSAYSEDSAAAFQHAYDNFFAEAGMAHQATGFYRASIPLQGKPLACIKRGHKLRTREKRAFKQQIQATCASYFENSAPAASQKLL